MWTAKCSYVRNLLPPKPNGQCLKNVFELEKEGRLVNGMYKGRKARDKWYFALELYALEHWIGSHEDLRPFDVS
jgi:hypothetical protein